MNSTIELIRAKANTKVTIEDPKLGKLDWTLRPIPAYDLLENFDLFTNIPKEEALDKDEFTEKDAKQIKNSIFPIMRIILPACSVEPIVTVNSDDPSLKDGTGIHMRDLPFNVVVSLFNEIIKLTGLGEGMEEARKKLQAQISPKA